MDKTLIEQTNAITDLKVQCANSYKYTDDQINIINKKVDIFMKQLEPKIIEIVRNENNSRFHIPDQSRQTYKRFDAPFEYNPPNYNNQQYGLASSSTYSDPNLHYNYQPYDSANINSTEDTNVHNVQDDVSVVSDATDIPIGNTENNLTTPSTNNNIMSAYTYPNRITRSVSRAFGFNSEEPY